MTGEPAALAPFGLRLEEAGAGVTVWASGELDLAAAETLRATLEDAARRGPVVLDLTEVVFADGSALGGVVAARKDAGDDARIVLRNPNALVTRLLRLTQLDQSFPIERGSATGAG